MLHQDEECVSDFGDASSSPSISSVSMLVHNKISCNILILMLDF